MTYAEDRVLAAAREAVASLGAMVRELADVNRPGWFNDRTLEGFHLHNRPEPVRRRVKRTYRPRAGRRV